ncbi:MAG: Ig-like domain-containing protein, partial [Gemmatimonadetes bacterium]|nr:Ig-like domain-containing protein [Gemmatimonadota bacterium]
MLPDLRCAKRWKAIVCALALTAAYASSEGRAQGARPFTLEQLEEIVKSGLIAEARLVTLLGERCVDFVADEASLTRLRAAGATDPVLEAVGRACRVLPGEARWVRIEPRRAEIRVGKALALTAVVLAGDSSEIRDASVRWASSDSTKVAVGPDGRVTAMGRGVAVVTATAPSGVVDSVTIRAFTGARVEITPYAGVFVPTTSVVDQAELQTKHQAAALFGGRLTGWLTDWLGLEGALAFSPSSAE